MERKPWRKLAVIILVATMICTMTPILPGAGGTAAAAAADSGTLTLKNTGGANPVVDEDGTHVYYGSYPTTEIVDAEEHSGVTRNDSLKELQLGGGYEVNASLYAALQSATYDRNGDTTVTVDGKKARYRRIRSTDVPTADINHEWSSRAFYWDDEETYHYFRYDPIKWRILKMDGDDAFLLAEYSIDANYFHDQQDPQLTWEVSYMRQWMNSTMMDTAFSQDEQKNIRDTDLINNLTTVRSDVNSGNDTTDKLFLLSGNDLCDPNAAGDDKGMNEYGFQKGQTYNHYSRYASVTTYGMARGAMAIHVDASTDEPESTTAAWWLRTRGLNNSGITRVQISSNGGISSQQPIYVYAVRPAMHLKIAAGNPLLPSTVSSSDASLSSDTMGYSGGVPRTPKVSIDGLREGVDYTVAYRNNCEIGEASAIITGTGNWSGTITKYFSIVSRADLPEPSHSVYFKESGGVLYLNKENAGGYREYAPESQSGRITPSITDCITVRSLSRMRSHRTQCMRGSAIRRI